MDNLEGLLTMNQVVKFEPKSLFQLGLTVFLTAVAIAIVIKRIK